MLKSCAYCGRIHDSKHDCGRKPKRIKQPTTHDRFRWSQAWQKKREEIKQRDLFLCQICRINGRYVSEPLEVHHIIPLADDYDTRLDNDNLITLCSRCHEQAEAGDLARAYLRRLVNQ